MNIAVLADTHLRTQPDGSFRRWLPEAATDLLAAADVILHAGDVLDQGVLDRLAQHGPVHAVLGNNDLTLASALPVSRVVELAGVRIGMIHDSGPTAGRAARMRRRFPDCAVVVFGHSHAPVNESGLDGQLLFNPGSATQRRAQAHHTMGQLIVQGGAVVDRRILEVS